MLVQKCSRVGAAAGSWKLSKIAPAGPFAASLVSLLPFFSYNFHRRDKCHIAKSPPFQFSIRLLPAIITILAVALAAIVQVPQVFVFALGLAGVIFTSLTTYRQARDSRLRLHVLAALIVARLVFYALSIGPFILLSEFDRKLTGQHQIGRLASAYRPVVAHFNPAESFR